MMRGERQGLKASAISFRLLSSVIGVSAVFFVLFGGAAVQQIAGLTRARVHGAATALVTMRAQEIADFFAERGRVVDTVFANPAVIGWFAAYDEFRRPLEGDERYQEIIADFEAVVDSDPVITSVFLATDATGEYFRATGRVEREGYDPKTRWWWREALEKDRLYVSPPGVDAGTGQVSVTVQTTLYLEGGRLLGVAGIDVLLGTLGALVSDIKYQGLGDAFLADEAGNLIYFPGLDLTPEALDQPFATRLAEVDRLVPDSAGFASLDRFVAERRPGVHRVRWRGEQRVVVHAPVSSDSPELAWSLGLMVPEKLISAPILRAKVEAALSVLVAVSLIAGMTLYLSNRVNRSLREEEHRRAEILAEANVRLQEADRMKSQFLATMSHELRTPLNSIIGFSEILRTRLAGDIDPTFSRFLDNIHSSGQHLLSMISDILDLSKVEAGKMELSLQAVDVAETLRSVCAIVHGIASDRRVKVELDVADAVPAVLADVVRFKQILFNLLSNAVKFSLDGSVVVVSARELLADRSPLGEWSVQVEVADHGIGIPSAEHQAIFEEFRQLDGSGARRHGGTGLGLALVKRLVELHRGTVAVASAPGEGSTFTVVLPATPAPVGSLVRTDDGARQAPGRRSILVVEDDDFAWQAMRDALEGAGYRAVRSATGEAALDLARRLRPVAIVLDIILPDRDGWDVLRELRRSPQLERIPVIIVSVLANHELGLALGADAYFTKPVDGEQVLRQLNRLAAAGGDREPWVLVIDDDPQLHEMLGEVLKRGGFRVGHAFSGVDGLSLARTRQPQLIILDLMMEGMDGFEVARELQHEPLTRGIPVVVLTARETTADDRRRLQGKIEALVEKARTPLPELLPLVDGLLGRRPANGSDSTD